MSAAGMLDAYSVDYMTLIIFTHSKRRYVCKSEFKEGKNTTYRSLGLINIKYSNKMKIFM